MGTVTGAAVVRLSFAASPLPLHQAWLPEWMRSAGVAPPAHLTPATDDTEFIEKLIHDSLQSPQREGFVLVRSSLTAQPR